MTQVEIEQAVESIWTLFRETDRRLDQRIAETDWRFDQRIAETDRRFEATEREIATLSAQTRAAENLFISQWGRLLEALVEPGWSGCSRRWGSRSTATWTAAGAPGRRGAGDRPAAGGR